MYQLNTTGATANSDVIHSQLYACNQLHECSVSKSVHIFPEYNTEASKVYVKNMSNLLRLFMLMVLEQGLGEFV